VWEKQLSGATVIDIGANVGEFSRFVAKRAKMVLAVEPDRDNLPSLRQNLSGLNVRIVQKALWKEKAELEFYSAASDADSSLIKPQEYKESYRVEAVPLDDLTEEFGLGEILLIKADAEGAEPEVLDGAMRTLERTHYIAIDCGLERNGEDTFEACTRRLESAGFTVRRHRRRNDVLIGVNRRFV
jgi:FkbM family methyltransferase